MDCDARAIKQGRCDAHWQAYRQRPGVRAQQRRRDAIRMGQDAAAQLRKQIRGTWQHCSCCMAYLPASQLDIDHKVPLYKGGEDVAENVRLLCRESCHKIKTMVDAGKAPF